MSLLASCGGNSSSGETSASSAALTKSEFLKRANATCTKNLEEKDAALQEAFSKQQGTPSSKELEALAVEAVIPAYNNLVEELEQLTPPSSDATVVEKILADYRAEMKQVEEDPRQLIRSEPFKQTNEAARNLGLETCSL